MTEAKVKAKEKKQHLWLVYLALLIAGAILLADAFEIAQMNRWTAKLGISLVWTALALFTGGGRPVGIAGVAIVWLAVLATFLL